MDNRGGDVGGGLEVLSANAAIASYGNFMTVKLDETLGRDLGRLPNRRGYIVPSICRVDVVVLNGQIHADDLPQLVHISIASVAVLALRSGLESPRTPVLTAATASPLTQAIVTGRNPKQWPPSTVFLSQQNDSAPSFKLPPTAQVVHCAATNGDLDKEVPVHRRLPLPRHRAGVVGRGTPSSSASEAPT